MARILGHMGPHRDDLDHTRAAIVRVVGESQLFAQTTLPSWERIAVGATRERVAKDAPIFWQGDAATHFVLIEAGLVKVERPGAHGEPSILGVFGPHESVGVPALLEGGTYPACAVAVSRDVVVVRLPAAPILARAATEAALAHAMKEALLRHTHVMHVKVALVSEGSVAARIARLLLDLGERFGRPGSRGHLLVPFTLPRACVAGLVAARVETVIRAFARLRQEGSFREVDTGGFELVPAALERVD